MCSQEITALTKCLHVVLRFYENLRSALHQENRNEPAVPHSHVPQEAQRPGPGLEKEAGAAAEVREERNGVYQRRRRREKHKEKDCWLDDAGSCSVSQLEDCLDLFTWWFFRRTTATFYKNIAQVWHIHWQTWAMNVLRSGVLSTSLCSCVTICSVFAVCRLVHIDSIKLY